MIALARVKLPLSTDFGNAEPLTQGLSCTQASDINAPSAENASFVVVQTHPRRCNEGTTIECLTIYATAGGGRSAETSYTWMSASNYKCREMADFGHLKGEVATWLTTFAPILRSVSLRAISDKSLIVLGVTSVRSKLPRL
jgi:hypothetical protein